MANDTRETKPLPTMRITHGTTAHFNLALRHASVPGSIPPYAHMTAECAFDAGHILLELEACVSMLGVERDQPPTLHLRTTLYERQSRPNEPGDHYAAVAVAEEDLPAASPGDLPSIVAMIHPDTDTEYAAGMPE